jgi:hypothetical protein
MAKNKIDFDNEEAVLDEIADELDIDRDKLNIEVERGLTSFSVGTVYEITIRGHGGGGGHNEWNVVENDDVERELALEIVKQDLDSEPEIFNQGFIESHIDTDHLRDELHSDTLNNNIETLEDRDADEFWREYEGAGFSLPEDVYEESEEEDDHGDARDPTHSEVEELAEKQTEEQLRDPMSYLEEIYGKEEATKEAIRIAGIDIDAAAEDAVDTDGAGHFLSSYDGSTSETKSGLVYWRTN